MLKMPVTSRGIENALYEALLQLDGIKLTDAAAGTITLLERLLKSILTEGDQDALIHNKAVIIEALERLESEVLSFDPHEQPR
jgi:hypothetical protein